MPYSRPLEYSKFLAAHLLPRGRHQVFSLRRSLVNFTVTVFRRASAAKCVIL